MDGQRVFIWEGGADCLVKPVHCIYCIFSLVTGSLILGSSLVSKPVWVATKSQYENGTFSKENLVI